MNGLELRAVREAVGFTHDDLARHLSKSKSMVQKWEAGHPVPAGIAVEVDGLHDAYADDRDKALTAAATVISVPRGGSRDAEEACWAATGRPSRWWRQIAAEVRQEHGTRIVWAEPVTPRWEPAPHDPLALLDQEDH